jgi:gliding motility-associated-like protein
LNPKAKPGTTTTYTLQTVCGTCISSFDSMTLTVTPAPVVNIGPDRVNTCFGTSGVSLPTTVTGGSGNLLYFWSPAAGLSNPRIPNPIASPNQTTMYSLVVIDTEGCQSDSDFVQVFVDSIPYADAGPDFFICENGPGVQLQPQGLLGGFGSYNFVWTPAAGLNDPTSPAPIARPDTTTIYQLEVINRQTGCSSRATGLDTLSTVLVSVTPRPIAEGGLNQTICVNDSVQLGGLPSNGGFTYTYAWSPSAGLSDSTAARPMASPRFTTQYFVTVSSLGCPSVIDSVTVTVKPVPTASTQPTEEVCRGDSVQLISYAAAGAAIGYRWEPATGLSDPRAARPLASPAQDTRYDLFVSFDGCETFSGASVFVSVLDAPQLDADTVHAQNGFDTQDGFRLCQGDSLVLPARLGANRVDYFYWEANPTLSRTDVVNPTARPTESVVYYVVAAIGGCESRDSILVQVLPEINPQIEGPTEVICARQEVLLTASGGIGSARYRWWPADGLNRTDGSVVLASPAQTTTYYVEVSEGGCADTASFTLSVLPQPVLDFDYSYDAGCTGLSVSFANLSTDGAAYIWDFGDGSPVVNAPEPTHTYPQPGQYLVSLRVPAGSSCYDEIRMERIIDVRDPLQAAFDAQPPAPITLTIPEAIVTVQAQTPNAVSWFWQFGDGQTATTPIATHQYRYAGEYIVSLQVTDAIGCKADVQSARYTVRAPELDIPSVFTPNGDGFNDRWIVGYTGVERYRAWVMDRWGQVVFDANSATQHWDGNDAKGNPVPTGVYFYVVETGERTFKGNVSILR